MINTTRTILFCWLFSVLFHNLLHRCKWTQPWAHRNLPVKTIHWFIFMESPMVYAPSCLVANGAQMIIKRFSNNLSFSSAPANSKDEDYLIPPSRKKGRSAQTKGSKTREKLSATESHNLLREPPRLQNPHTIFHEQ